MIRKLFSANPARIGRFDGPPKCDAVPASLVDGTPSDLKADLIALLGKENVLHRAIDLVRYASDASPYRLIPQVVVQPRTTDDIVKLFRYCRENGRHATLRAAGTSLNGQSQSDDILIDVRRHWYGAKVEDDGCRVRARARPGMILGHVNAMLGRYGRRLGPDPASSNACTIGGVIANNSGGMRCTVKNDAYQTVSAMTFVTPSGAVIDTSASDAEAAFERAEPDLAIGLLELRGQLLADRELADRVRRKYAIRNTHGYRLCALLDGETPLEIFRRLLVGSEGTLAFVAEAVIDTVPTPGVTSVAWIPVPTIDEAVGLVSGLVGLGATAVELMVAPALTAAGQAFARTPCYWKTLDPKAAALLVEFGAEDMRALEVLQNKVIELTSSANLIHPVEFTSVEEAVELAWHVREGLLGLIGKLRPKGSTLITEDVCFPPERLAQGARDVQELLSKIFSLLPDWTLRPVVDGLQAMRGIAQINAVVLVTEVGDFTRFSNPRQLMAYFGLVPGERSSGETVRRGAITKTGNAHARRALVEGAWAYRMKARIGRHKVDRIEALPKVIRDIGWKAQVRLCARYRRLSARGKTANVVNVAIAREMVGFIWSIACTI